MERLAIVGAGGLGSRLAHHALTDGHYKPVGFFDDDKNLGKEQHGLPILGNIKDIISVYEQKVFDVLIISLGYFHLELREDLFNRLKDIVPFGTVIHSRAYVDKTSKIGSGVFIYPGCVIDVNSQVCNNVIITSGCIVAHDSVIGEHSFLSPSVNIAGYVSIGQKTNLGIGTTVIDNIKIAGNIRTGGGSVVIDDLETPGLYVGVPARLIKSF